MKRNNKKRLLLCTVLTVVALLLGTVGIFGVMASAVTPELRIDYCNLSFRDTVCIKYAVAAKGTDDVRLLVWNTPQGNYAVGTEALQITESYVDTVDGTRYRIFDYTALTAKQMTDDVYVRAYSRVGEDDVYSEVNKYSVIQYALNMMENSTNISLKEMLGEMLDYGAAAQKNFGYRTDRPANGEFFRVEVHGGTLSDGFGVGVYAPGEVITLCAPEVNEAGQSFSYWVNSEEKTVGLSANRNVTVGNRNESYTAVYGSQTIPPMAENTSYEVTETYMPSAVSAKMKTYFETKWSDFYAFSAGAAPFSPLNTSSLSGTRLISMSVPVLKVTNPDADGNYVLTLFVVGNTNEGLKTTRRTVAVKLNGEAHHLTANSAVNRWLKLDLSDLNLTLAADETVAYFSGSDSIIPAYISGSTSAPVVLMRNEFPQGLGFFNKAGTGSLTFSDNSNIVVDFEMVRSYDSRTAYEAELAEAAELEAMKAAVAQRYGGKNLSILGDSISTYAGVSNNTALNGTIGSNAVFYQEGSGGHQNVSDASKTYWGRLLTDTGMNLCVNNSWSGSRVYGAAGTGSGNMLSRATQLHRTANGTEPDLILVYMGINDLHNDSDVPFGDLYAILSDESDTRSDREKIAAWFSAVQAQAATAGASVSQGSTYTTFEQAYALSLSAIAERYPNADVFCITFAPNADSRCTQKKLNEYGRCVRALAEYFGFGIVDQSEGVVGFENCLSYTGESQGLHGSSWGHQKLEELVIRSIYEQKCQ